MTSSEPTARVCRQLTGAGGIPASGAAVAALAIVLTGCGGSGDGGSAPPAAPSIPVAEHPAGAAARAAATTGVVELALECVQVEVDGRIVVPVFPQGAATVSGEVLKYGGKDYAAGDEIRLKGVMESAAPKGATVPEDCLAVEYLVVSP